MRLILKECSSLDQYRMFMSPPLRLSLYLSLYVSLYVRRTGRFDPGRRRTRGVHLLESPSLSLSCRLVYGAASSGLSLQLPASWRVYVPLATSRPSSRHPPVPFPSCGWLGLPGRATLLAWPATAAGPAKINKTQLLLERISFCFFLRRLTRLPRFTAVAERGRATFCRSRMAKKTSLSTQHERRHFRHTERSCATWWPSSAFFAN